MENRWARYIRSIGTKQKEDVVDATISKSNRLMLKTRDGQEIDAGLIKKKDHGSIVIVAYSVSTDEPDMYITKDGNTWVAATSQGRYAGGTNDFAKSGCWTGDRYLVAVYSDLETYSCVLQSFDGGTWAFHPDYFIFSWYISGYIHAFDSDGLGFVIAVGSTDFGEYGIDNANIAVSYDFGETWKVFPTYDEELGEDIYPFATNELFSVCVKNKYEWLIYDNSILWYTYDGGTHWNEVDYPLDFNISYYGRGGIRYFNGCWWLYGYGGNDVIIKSDDLINWVSVPTPWDANYPPYLSHSSGPHYAGAVYNMEYDPLSNTVVATGGHSATETPDSVVLMSTNGGENWFEIGWEHDDIFRTDYGWDGEYNWNDEWTVDFSYSGMACGYGRWFLINEATPDGLHPSMIRISFDGKKSEAVYIGLQIDMNPYMILSGGDQT